MRQTIRRRNILFLCEDNASLSQMAEAVAKHLNPPKVKIFSAGVTPTEIPAYVYRVMGELGISLTGHSSKKVNDVPLNDIDLVVSFGDVDKKCGSLPARAKVERWPVSRPSLARSSEPETLRSYRHERDEIDKRVCALFLDYWRNVV